MPKIIAKQDNNLKKDTNKDTEKDIKKNTEKDTEKDIKKDIVKDIKKDTEKDTEKDIENVIKQINKKKVVTEKLGKEFEMGICLLYNIKYDGTFSYELDNPNELKDKLKKLKEIFNYNIKHTAKGGAKYDFTSNDEKNHLSAKTTKKDGKVCPQVIGQPSKNKFCEYFNLDNSTTHDEIKKYIIKNILTLLDKYFENTFMCDTIYYNQKKDKIIYIKNKNKIDWSKFDIKFSHQIKNKKWNESTTIKLNKDDIEYSIGEFQIHKKRSSIKFRWMFEKILDIFKDNFEIIDIYN